MYMLNNEKSPYDFYENPTSVGRQIVVAARNRYMMHALHIVLKKLILYYFCLKTNCL